MALTSSQLKEHVLNRTGSGISASSSALYDSLGFNGYIDWQLDQCYDGSLEPALSLAFSSAPPSGYAGQFVERESERNKAQRRKVLRPIYKDEQLADVLADFWFNHFNVQSATAAAVAFWSHPYLDEIFSKGMMGSFRALLEQNAMSHEMQGYLDNVENIRGANENLGREILELHTVGIDAGYTQDDVKAASKILSGWNGGVFYETIAANPGGVNELWFDEGRHFSGAKTVMGTNYPADVAGQVEQQRFLDQLAGHPATIERMSAKLCQLFIADDPPPSAVSSAVATWNATGGDLGAVTRAILLSPEFVADEAFRAKRKRPRHFVASVARALDAQDVNDNVGYWKAADIEGMQPTFVNESLPVDFVERMSEALYTYGVPTGHSFDSRDWMSGALLGTRFELVQHATDNWMSNLSGLVGLNTPDTIDALVERFVPGGISIETVAAVTNHISELGDTDRLREGAAVLLSSPEFGAC